MGCSMVLVGDFCAENREKVPKKLKKISRKIKK